MTYLECSRDALLAACYVQARRCNGIISSALQILAIMNILEEFVATIYNCLWQVDAISHAADLPECIQKSSVRAAHLQHKM